MSVKSAERVLKIFELLSEHSQGLTNKEISEAMDYAKSSTFALLKTLSDEGYLIADEQKRYTLGGKLIQLGNIAFSHMDIGKLARPFLYDVMKRLEETCFLGVLSQDEVVYIEKANSSRTINTNASVGSRKPIYCTGLGKAFLAFLPPKDSVKIMKNIEYIRYTKHTVGNEKELRKQLQQFRLSGYAIDNEEIEEGLFCLAVPVYDGYGRMTAAISVSGPKPRMLEKIDLIQDSMLEASKLLSQKLGYNKEEI